MEKLKNLLKTYPALSAALINFGLFAAGYFGLNITADQLVAAVGVLDVLFGVIVHSNVVPLARHNAIVESRKSQVSNVVLSRGYPAGDTTVSELPPPPSSVSVQNDE